MTRATEETGSTVTNMNLDDALDNMRAALHHLSNEDAEQAVTLYESMHGTVPPPGTVLQGPRLYGFKGSIVVILDATTGARIVPQDVMRHDGRPFWFEAQGVWDTAGNLIIEVVSAVRTLGGRQIPSISIARRQLEQELNTQMAAWADQHATTIARLRSTMLYGNVRARTFELIQVARRLHTIADDISDSLAELSTSDSSRPLYRQLRNNGLDPWDAYQATQAME